MEQTLSILKPDVVSRNQMGKIIAKLEAASLKIVGAKMVHLTKQEAEKFYAIHKGKPFFDELTTFLSSGPIMPMVLQGKNAIATNRKVMGATDPKKAEEGTIRKEFGTSIGSNAVHGSDAPDTAKFEINFFFSTDEILSR